MRTINILLFPGLPLFRLGQGVSSGIFFNFKLCSGSLTFWHGSGSMDLYTGLHILNWIWVLILLFSSVAFKMPTKNIFFSPSCFAYSYCRYITLVFKEVTKPWKSRFFIIFFFLFMEGSIQIITDPDPKSKNLQIWNTESSLTDIILKWLSHEIDFKNFDQNLKN